VTTKNSHCSYCGRPFPDNAAWPRTCARCGETSYLNPIPVTVVLAPIDTGLLAVRRAIEPGRGRLALPGGFVNAGESWQAAGVREVAEETGLRLGPDELSVFAVHSTPAPADNVLIFALARPRAAADLPAFSPNAETSELVVLTGPQPLAFPLHTRVAGEYFARRATARD
jgi:ADP-ribose pyrophosphatase YjhB (NUDIX family)